MVWINFFICFISLASAAELPKFLTKHSIDSIRYITMDGRFAYVKKSPGVLGMVSSFRSVDFLSSTSTSDFTVRGSRTRKRLVIEVIPNVHGEYDLYKKNKIMTMEIGNTVPKEMGFGVSAKLHLVDEWLSFYNTIEKELTIKNIITEKTYTFALQAKMNPYFRPEVEMVSSDTILYTDLNEQGYTALMSYNLLTQKSSILYRASQTATRLELCSSSAAIGVGEFPYEGVERGSKIMQISQPSGGNLAGLTTIYTSQDQDLGNMICTNKGYYFVKTMGVERKLQIKNTEAVFVDLTGKVEAKTSLKHVNQIIEMDGRILVPDRGEYYVLEGRSNLSDDVLRVVPPKNEELPLEL
jgi:hypothetical protein